MVSVRFALPVAIICLALTQQAAAENKPSTETNNWEPLENDVPREDLFAYIVKDRLAGGAISPGEEGPISAPLKGNFSFPHDAIVDDATGLKRTASIFGIDISHYTDSSLDLTALKRQKIDFVYVKATQGTKYGDAKFPLFWASLGQGPANYRVLRGAYHFLSSSGDGKAQADRFISYVNKAGGFGPDDLPPCVDLEWDVDKVGGPDKWLSRTPDEIVDTAVAWLERVEAVTHKIPMIYTNRVWWQSAIKSESKFSRLAQYRIWIADYSGSDRVIEVPSVPGGGNAHIWQFTATSHLANYGKGLDANIYKGSRAQFASEMQISPSIVGQDQ
ncbi:MULTISPECIES: GH25 family lysozyme [unclassified Rhizobium]|uniref:GH25 family lysozyme n=1 Tax=unclassified Rhizobium TaxID=2613769 RepID=UPI000DDA54A9|nr:MULTISPECIES: GH25 family lysozyme [unclassified Rhizobium]MBB3386855.1 lysozyme [Rhizobium sp. BK098]MBB3618750.1 lysozyme [Rhizobium sp. BK609]MBB3684216.1 lysozyme [Rhizobium sp. BK612]